MARALFLASAMLLAACSGAGSPGDGLPRDMAVDGCGSANQRCCANNTCIDGSTCSGGICQPTTCGHAGEHCCNGTTCVQAQCVNNLCTGTCGLKGFPCCNGTTCTDGTTCMNGACGTPPPMLAGSGDPCTKNTDCAGTKPLCIIKDAQGITWPDGYCTSQCNPTKNDPKTGINLACPGGNGICLGQGTTGSCETACTAKNGAMPCKRLGYSCFQGCEPSAYSECDPTMKGVCGQGKTCVRIGTDDVGICRPACDPFQQDCVDVGEGCYASYDTGEGSCSISYLGGDGAACDFLNSCDRGLICYAPQNQMAACRPYCGGPNHVSCNNGRVCVDFSPKVPKAVVGVCGG